MTAPILAAGVVPVVDSDQPHVEGVPLRNRQSGKLAVIVMNWSTPLEEPVQLRIRDAGEISGLTSLALRRELPATTLNGWTTVALPSLEDGDILLVE